MTAQPGQSVMAKVGVDGWLEAMEARTVEGDEPMFQFTDGPGQEAHHYIHWPRERFCWYRLARA